jgi:hypothetical protein
LNPEQQARIASEFKSLHGEHATIVWGGQSFEAARFASQIDMALRSAEWVTRLQPANPGFHGLPVVGGVLIMTEPPEASQKAGAALLGALQKEGVTVSVMPFDRHGVEGLYAKSTDPEDWRILVVVGSHP